MPFFIRIGNHLAKLRNILSPVKNKVRLKHPNAIFLPINELDELIKESDKKLAIAAEMYNDKITLVLNDYSELNIQKSDLAPKPVHDRIFTPVDFSKPYLTDWGQTLGFGNFGDYEIDISIYVDTNKSEKSF